MSYAVIRTGGKQYRVRQGDNLRIEKIPGDPGAEVEFKDILLANKDGEVVLDAKALGEMKVTAKILRHGRGRKVHTFKFRRRKGFQKRIGHRQSFTEVLINGISEYTPA